DGILQIAELADPLEPVAGWQLHFLGNLLLGLEHRAAEIAAPHREFDRQIAFLLLAIDERGAGYDIDPRHLAQGNLDDAGTTGILRPDRDVANGFQALAVFGRKPHTHVEVAVAAIFVEIARCLAADRGLHRRVDIARRQPVPRRLGAVDVDLHRWLAERRE